MCSWGFQNISDMQMNATEEYFLSSYCLLCFTRWFDFLAFDYIRG